MKDNLNEKGLTLIEVIISLAIISIVVISFLTMFTSGFDTVFSMGRRTEATRIAQQFLDEHYAAEPLDINNLPNVPSISPYMVQRDRQNGPDGLNQITITVLYRNGSRSVTLTGLVP
ncbi:type IV pilus modification PilV family protein [Anoxynatronum buryatiense]|uniref:Prepilin-type N-terminal cleavage/methylation domain-containing protein n=1 Tax=Anoxynatronum buryatiense TaxID=489973 RepID=A0AA45WUN6_9CLOT|nr:type II secretion system protein [Anoxynatronum buryatiense]SMP48828.1 prepilin-type N-terminal cleavage/methylation domain-containing protein [Anoxynatronum buryatiense]